jgi:uroporphyrinogen-III synthase
MTSARRATVVVTRPIGQSAALLARLAADGFDTLEFPLIDIAPVSDDALLRAALDELYGPRKSYSCRRTPSTTRSASSALRGRRMCRWAS